MAPNRPRVPEYHEGPEAARRFKQGMSRVLSVSKEELLKREAASQKTRIAKRNRQTHKAT